MIIDVVAMLEFISLFFNQAIFKFEHCMKSQAESQAFCQLMSASLILALTTGQEAQKSQRCQRNIDSPNLQLPVIYNISIELVKFLTFRA